MGWGLGSFTCVWGLDSGSLETGSGGGSAFAAAGCGGGAVLARGSFISHAESSRAKTPIIALNTRRMSL
jgi:hypothetical protein